MFRNVEKLDNKKLIKILSNHTTESLTFPATRYFHSAGEPMEYHIPSSSEATSSLVSTCPNSSPRFQRATRSRPRQQTRPIARYPHYLISIDLPWIRAVPENFDIQFVYPGVARPVRFGDGPITFHREDL